ncbi:unnamed protein product [Colias eurytheme]|nr:unnamed protein product [Colias eurytheme]
MAELSDKEYQLYFISLFRDSPQLWKEKSNEYKDKHKRDLALKKMVQVLKVCRPQITEEDVKKKINILLTTFNRENKKVKKSRVSGSSTDDLYVPSLWYFKELQFLEDQMEPESGIGTTGSEVSSVIF